MKFNHVLRHWGTDSFAPVLKAELERLPAGTLPLHQATTQGGIIADNDIEVSVLSSEASGNKIRIRVAVFFTEIVAGCNCNDPPLEANGYCLLEVVIDRASAEARVAIIPD